ncbi:MAG TPA: hypothetical protein VIJ35_29855, partial [Bradyrhizobium sp.]
MRHPVARTSEAKEHWQAIFSSAALRFDVPGASAWQPVQVLQIGGAGDNVPDFPAFLAAMARRSDSAGTAIVEICRI